MSNKGWIGVDLDGTLAEYDMWEGPLSIGKPIPAMVERVKRWLAEGYEVRIFTARASSDGSIDGDAVARSAETAVDEWVIKHIGRRLRITCLKDYRMIELWDDRAVAVEMNTGKQLSPSTRDLDD